MPIPNLRVIYGKTEFLPETKVEGFIVDIDINIFLKALVSSQSDK